MHEEVHDTEVPQHLSAAYPFSTAPIPPPHAMMRRLCGRFLDDPLPDLKRFSEARRTSKLSTFVNFPMKDLDLREFSSENSSKSEQQRGGVGGGGRRRSRVYVSPLSLQQTRSTASTQCPTTQAPRWAATTQRTVATPARENGTRSTTPGSVQMFCRRCERGRRCSLDVLSPLVSLLLLLRFRVTPMSSSQVRSSDAYVLFYELTFSSRM